MISIGIIGVGFVGNAVYHTFSPYFKIRLYDKYKPGYEDLKTVAANASIPIYHKIALCAIPSGSDVIKYGQVIGMATSDIIKGDWVHVHNVESKRGRGDLK